MEVASLSLLSLAVSDRWVWVWAPLSPPISDNQPVHTPGHRSLISGILGWHPPCPPLHRHLAAPLSPQCLWQKQPWEGNCGSPSLHSPQLCCSLCFRGTAARGGPKGRYRTGCVSTGPSSPTRRCQRERKENAGREEEMLVLPCAARRFCLLQKGICRDGWWSIHPCIPGSPVLPPRTALVNSLLFPFAACWLPGRVAQRPRVLSFPRHSPAQAPLGAAVTRCCSWSVAVALWGRPACRVLLRPQLF